MSLRQIKILSLLNENILQPTGGLGVGVRDISEQLSYINNVELTVAGVDYKDQNGGLYSVDSKVERCEFNDWKYKKNHYRLLNIFNTNEVITRYGYITKQITINMFVENILNFLKDDKFDIIHLQDSTLYQVAKILQTFYRCKLITTCHLSFSLCHETCPESPYYMLDSQCEALAFHNSNKVISVSNNYTEKIKERYMLENTKSILNGINFDFLQTIKYNQELKNKYLDKPLVVFVGRLVPSKGLELIIKTIKKLKNYYFVLISNIAPSLEDLMPLAGKLKKMKKKYKNFVWLNNLAQSKKWEYMKIADVGIMPSLHEPFGLVALEFMALQTPLIVTQNDGLREFCNNDNADIMLPTLKDLIKKIKEFKRNDIKIQTAYKLAKKMTWENSAKQINEVYKEVA